MVRGKFKVESHKKFQWSPTLREIMLTAQYDPTIEEDKKFAQATPSGSITMLVDNPSAIAALAIGSSFYVDFTEVPEAK